MVLPERIYRAARDGDRDTVIAYLNAPAEAGGLPDVNEQSFTGGTILMAAVCQIDSAARLAFVWELVGRGADLSDARNVCSVVPRVRLCPSYVRTIAQIRCGVPVETDSLVAATMRSAL